MDRTKRRSTPTRPIAAEYNNSSTVATGRYYSSRTTCTGTSTDTSRCSFTVTLKSPSVLIGFASFLGDGHLDGAHHLAQIRRVGVFFRVATQVGLALLLDDLLIRFRG